jgi:outer membrane receptor protein involved in Fe transport
MLLITTALLPCLAAWQIARGQTPDGTTPAPPVATLPDVNIIGSTPLLGTGVQRDSVPAASQVLTPQDINRTGIPSLTDALQSQLPSVHLSDLSGNPFQPDVLFRGFTASPVEGETQGLAVYVNGARFNAPFGDTVNWDLIPPSAIAAVNVEGGNPVFGLNALGGSVAVRLKDGFSYHGGEFIAYGGSYGRAAAGLQYGIESGNTAAYIAADAIHDHGWHDTSGSEIRRVYTDLGWRSEVSEVHLSITAADNRLGNPGATPEDLLSLDRSANSTAPNSVTNRYLNLNLRGNYDVSDHTSVQGVVYYSNFSQRLINGDTSDDTACAADPAQLCEDDAVTPITTPNGGIVPASVAGANGMTSQLSLEGIDSNAYGASAQVANETTLFGRHNRLVAGLSVDAAETGFNDTTLVGGLTDNFWFVGPGYAVDQADLSTVPVSLKVYDQYYGAFFTDRFELTDRLAATASGRFNLADIALHDRNGTLLSGNHQYTRFNPGVGLTYQVLPPLQLFANYSEANRAPTPNELECANPAIPCLLPSAFVSDPNLKQVVARTVELGTRGRLPDIAGGRLTWDADVFRTENRDDIIFASNGSINQQGFFQNVGDTLRQGFEATIGWKRPGVRVKLGYTYTDATYQSTLTLESPNNPGADSNGQIHVVPGDRLPLVPAHRGTLTVDYDVTDRWTVGGSLIASSSQYLFFDDSNVTKPLGGYVVANLNTSYRVTDTIQVFGLVNNVTDQRYATFGSYVPASLISPSFTNNRAYTPAAPVEAFAGVRATF